MRKLIVLTFVTLDGVMQAPGGPEEDSSGGFKYGGWSMPLFDDADWKKTVPIDGDVVGKIKKLKQEDGPELQVHGSSNLIQTLLRNDLVDELWLKIYPITLGTGKRLFGEGTKPAGFRVLKSNVSPNGVIVASYGRAGDVKLGTVELTASGEQVIRS
jgi:hypothetical protein